MDSKEVILFLLFSSSGQVADLYSGPSSEVSFAVAHPMHL